MKPRRREEGLVSTEVEQEILVYDLDRDLGHQLDRISAVVWRHCDGTNSVDRLTELAAGELDGDVEEAAVRHALALLADAQLLEEPELVEREGLSRREALTRLAVAGAVALPVVSSFAVPSAAQAGVTTSPGSTGPTGVTGPTGP